MGLTEFVKEALAAARHRSLGSLIPLSRLSPSNHCQRTLLFILGLSIIVFLHDPSLIFEASSWKSSSLLVSYVSNGQRQPFLYSLSRDKRLLYFTRKRALESVGSVLRGGSDRKVKDRAVMLLQVWERMYASQLHNPEDERLQDGSVWEPSGGRVDGIDIPSAPHLQDCGALEEYQRRMDTRSESGGRPEWPLWGGALGLSISRTENEMRPSIDFGERLLGNKSRANTEGPYPPWVVGGDEDNLAMTRRAQRDIWLHQHPRNCSVDSVRFLHVDWATSKRLGTGAQLNQLAGALGLAMSNGLVLVVRNFDRANHEGCKGMDSKRMSCYFLPETSDSCRARVNELVKLRRLSNFTESPEKKVFAKTDFNDSSFWFPPVPRLWGEPWEEMHPTSEVNGTLVRKTRMPDIRWWRGQVFRYLLRFPSARTCRLLNTARHRAFGPHAAVLVAQALPPDWPKERSTSAEEGELESTVWKFRAPWVPRPLLSLHVRQGDKASEMKIAKFQDYMSLAERVRRRFPELRSVWLSTEMQVRGGQGLPPSPPSHVAHMRRGHKRHMCATARAPHTGRPASCLHVCDRFCCRGSPCSGACSSWPVIEESKSYGGWDFHYTDVPRQQSNQTMHDYETSVGRERSSDNAFVNLLMAVDADFFVGALGSTWCYVIDMLRMTGGKARQAYLSVNKDRYW